MSRRSIDNFWRVCYAWSTEVGSGNEKKVENPVRRARLSQHKTLKEFASDCGVHLQVVYLTEQGMYRHIPPAILDRLGKADSKFCYREFQREKRQKYGHLYGLSLIDLGPPEGGHPVVLLRRQIGVQQGHPNGLSRMGFAKTFCVHSSELYSLEMGLKSLISEQFREAMREAGLPDTMIGELEFRCQEWGDVERSERRRIQQ